MLSGVLYRKSKGTVEYSLACKGKVKWGEVMFWYGCATWRDVRIVWVGYRREKLRFVQVG